MPSVVRSEGDPPLCFHIQAPVRDFRDLTTDNGCRCILRAILPLASRTPVCAIPRMLLGRTSENANCPQFMILHRNGACRVSERPEVFPEAAPVLVVAVDQPTFDSSITCA
jgi:hypothetical protein